MKERKLYENKEWLEKKYVNEQLLTSEIAKLCNVKNCTIWRWLKKNNIKIRNSKENTMLSIERLGHPLQGKEVSKKTREKISESQKQFYKYNPSPFLGRKHSKESNEKNSESNKRWHKYHSHPLLGKTHSEEAKKKNSLSHKKLWKDPEYVKRTLISYKRRPNKIETLLDGMTPENVRYIGNGAWWRKLPNGRYKNPDFKVTGENKVIEVYGDYFHRNDNPQDLIVLYKQIGIDCLVIWENEINNQPQLVLEKVNVFII